MAQESEKKIYPKNISVPRPNPATDEGPSSLEAPARSANQPPSKKASDEADEVFIPAPASNIVVGTLIEQGLYGEALGGKLHKVTCPWAAEHRSDELLETTYEEPDDTNPIGRFHCTHAHAEARTATDLIERLQISAAMARSKPRIRVSPGDVHLAAAAAERVLADEGSYFHAGGPMVRIISRDGLGVSSEMVNDQTLNSVLSAKIDWERRGRANDWVRSDPPNSVVQILRHGQDRPHLPPLSGLARQPFYGADHRLIAAPGYDAGTGIYADFKGADYDLNALTRDKAEHALAYLNWLIGQFPFASDSDKSAALAAMLTAAVRPSLSQAPAFSISATRSGSGKSYLATLIALVAGPGDPHNVSYPTKADEATKVVLAMLLEKPAVILFDDMQTDWKSFGALNKALTSATTTERLLGSSRTATARTNVLFLGTGNNIEPEKDMRRRVLSIYLAPRSETPSLSTYRKEGPVEHVRRERARVVEAALTIIGAFQAAGQPFADVRPIGTFEEWSAYCRQPLLWLGEPDPAQSLINQVTHDSDQQLLAELLDVWFRHFGSRAMTVRKVIAKAEEQADLIDALAELSMLDGRYVNAGRLGWYLKKNRGRRAESLRIEPGDSSERRAWRVLAD